MGIWHHVDVTFSDGSECKRLDGIQDRRFSAVQRAGFDLYHAYRAPKLWFATMEKAVSVTVEPEVARSAFVLALGWFREVQRLHPDDDDVVDAEEQFLSTLSVPASDLEDAAAHTRALRGKVEVYDDRVFGMVEPILRFTWDVYANTRQAPCTLAVMQL